MFGQYKRVFGLIFGFFLCDSFGWNGPDRRLLNEFKRKYDFFGVKKVKNKAVLFLIYRVYMHWFKGVDVFKVVGNASLGSAISDSSKFHSLAIQKYPSDVERFAYILDFYIKSLDVDIEIYIRFVNFHRGKNIFEEFNSHTRRYLHSLPEVSDPDDRCRSFILGVIHLLQYILMTRSMSLFKTESVYKEKYFMQACFLNLVDLSSDCYRVEKGSKEVLLSSGDIEDLFWLIIGWRLYDISMDVMFDKLQLFIDMLIFGSFSNKLEMERRKRYIVNVIEYTKTYCAWDDVRKYEKKLYLLAGKHQYFLRYLANGLFKPYESKRWFMTLRDILCDKNTSGAAFISAILSIRSDDIKEVIVLARKAIRSHEKSSKNLTKAALYVELPVDAAAKLNKLMDLRKLGKKDLIIDFIEKEYARLFGEE